MSNTPPHAMLDVRADQVHEVAGDRLAGFWMVNADVADALTPDRPAYTPPQIRREAYSWGGLDRTTIGGGTPFGQKLVAAVVRAAWCLVLPYGLTNLAYWARDLGASAARVRRTATVVRLFGLGLTLLFVTTVVTVASDLVALQYLAGDTDALPSQLAPLARLTPQRRLAVSMLVPVAALAVLWLVSWTSRVRYDVDTPAQSERTAKDTPILRREGFWNNRAHATETALIHVGAGLATVAAMTTLFAPPRGQAFGWVLTATGIASAGAVLVAAGRLAATSSRGSDVPVARPEDTVTGGTRATVWGCVALFLAQLLLLFFGPGSGCPSPAARLDGLIAVPTVLVLLLLALALAGLSIRRVSPWWSVGLPALLAGAALLYLGGRAPLAVAVGAAVLVALLVLALPGNDFQAWRGRGVGVFLLLALGGAMLLSNLVVVGVGDWLNRSGSAAGLFSNQVGATAAGDPTGLRAPAIFAWFGVGLVLAAGAALLALPVVMYFAGRWSGVLRKTAAPGRPVDPDIVLADPSTLRARRLANAAHRAEPAVGGLAVLALVALLPCVILPLRPWAADGATPAPLLTLTAWGATFAAALAVLLAGGLVLQPGTGRPLGIVWDLLCVVPRAAHPFGPPSYSERAVPELVMRCHAWLGADDSRRVVLSAHSMGSVLAAAAILDPRSRLLVERGALLSYGSQLRAYFGRIFPELFGAEVVANAPATSARPFAADEFRGDTADATGTPDEGTLMRLLSNPTGDCRWVNLWRPTDYLGFPAYSRHENPVDLRADEIDRSGYLPTVGSHSGYPRTAQYRTALDALRRRIGPGGPSPGAGTDRAGSGET
ncbi:hypothetical protein [Rhodococcus kronopolitis]|uniref:Integral membrane protein n=1 Tax=Rhodococcus kronopolitis TaxID=1460226 RepID=A0ABV9FL57_9NOCA